MDMSQTKQLTLLPANLIAPDINTALRGCTRLSMKRACSQILKIGEWNQYPNWVMRLRIRFG
jgi:hypothetical protein